LNPAPLSTATGLLAVVAAGVAIAGIAAIWAGVAAITGTQCAWFAVVAALDAALLLRLAAWPTGRSRAVFALSITVATVLCANIFVAAAQIGRVMGLRPYEALPRMSLELAALHTHANTGWLEWIWYAIAVALAYRLGR
jgi:hypothetical protein